MDTQDLKKTVREMIVDILVLEPEEVQPTSRFFEDLGGESLDILDLTFRVEKRYGVRPPFQRLASAQEIETDAGGRLTQTALEALKAKAPYLNYAAFEQDPRTDRITELFTVDAIVHIVAAAIQEKELGGAQPAI